MIALSGNMEDGVCAGPARAARGSPTNGTGLVGPNIPLTLYNVKTCDTFIGVKTTKVSTTDQSYNLHRALHESSSTGNDSRSLI